MAHTQNDPIQLFPPGTPEYAILAEAAKKIADSTKIGTVSVCDTYFDFGQNWKWTTICAVSPSLGMPYQMLSPAQQHDVLHGTDKQRETAIQDVILKNSAKA